MPRRRDHFDAFQAIVAIASSLGLLTSVMIVLWKDAHPRTDVDSESTAPRGHEAIPETVELPPDQRPPEHRPSPQTSAPDLEQNPPPGPAWQGVLTASSPPVPFTSESFRVAPSNPSISPQRLRDWFAPVAGHSFEVSASTSSAPGTVPGTVLKGTASLRPPVRTDTTLRVLFHPEKAAQWHFFAGDLGVTLRYAPQAYSVWSGYTTSREAGSPHPRTLQLTATDDGRAARTGTGAVEIRYRNEEMILSRGDIALIRVPLSGAPTASFFHGAATFQQLALLRTKDFPSRGRRRRPQIATARPAEMKWSPPSEGTSLAKFPDGSVQLSTAGTDGGTVRSLIPLTGLSEVVVELSASVGAVGHCV